MRNPNVVPDVFAQSGYPSAMEPSLGQESCNAVEKIGRNVVICDKPLGHDADKPLAEIEHAQGDVTWRDRGGW